ncbi:class I SAM-dependent methyltransferase [Paenibacillus woosongensis]|uniref:Class I SAM-dependent methyltransferase n=1 Tax=Paenibacillus woosongensis TaxID=307580 RepID=A0AA95KU53_9BACL|nr:class I SAM-dependent methyltransferase [Paenibacillus woosongensis]WHX47020.1 class I SAM-dependent methyltransferase [Paenibacillus woosongensis]
MFYLMQAHSPGPEKRFLLMDAQDLRFADQAFDLVIASTAQPCWDMYRKIVLERK